MINLAISYSGFGRHTEALSLYEEALETQRRVLPKDHPDTLVCMNNQARCYVALGRRAEAVKLQEEALQTQRRLLPKDHPATLMGIQNLADGYDALGRHAEARTLREAALEGRSRALPKGHPDTLWSMMAVARSYVLANRHAEALKPVEEVLPKADSPGVDRSLYSGALAVRAACYQRAGDLAACRSTVELLEKRSPKGAASLYNAACCRAITAAMQAKAQKADAARLAWDDADTAMAWLGEAVDAGLKDATRIKNEPGLDCLRDREDFNQLLGELE